jgi:hypothetical protein
MSEEPAASSFRRWIIASEVLITVNILSNIGWNMTPCSLVGKSQNFEGTYCFHVQGKGRWNNMEVAGSSETLSIYQTTRRHVPKSAMLINSGLGTGHGTCEMQVCKVVPLLN